MPFALKSHLAPFSAGRWPWVCMAFLMLWGCGVDVDIPKRPTDTSHFDFVLRLNEHQTNAPVANAQVILYRYQTNERHPDRIDKFVSFKGNTDDSGRVVINQKLLGVDYIEVFPPSPNIHFPLKLFAPRPIPSVLQLFMDSKAYLRLHFDFAALASKGPNGRFDEVSYEMRDDKGLLAPAGSVSHSTVLLPVQVSGGRTVFVKLRGRKQGVVVSEWLNEVYVPLYQTHIHTVHLEHD